MGKTLIINGNIKSIDEWQFCFKNIDNLVLKNGVKYIGKFAFVYNNIKRLYLPKSIIKAELCAFNHNPLEELIFYNNSSYLENFCFGCKIKELTIIDCDYNFLYQFLEQNNNLKYYSFGKIEKINIVNSNLDYTEKLKIELFLLLHYPNININFLDNLDLNIFGKQNIKLEFLNGEVNNLIATENKIKDDEIDKILTKIK